MSEDYSGSRPKIEFHSLERIGRELRGMYDKLAPEIAVTVTATLVPRS